MSPHNPPFELDFEIPKRPAKQLVSPTLIRTVNFTISTIFLSLLLYVFIRRNFA